MSAAQTLKNMSLTVRLDSRGGLVVGGLLSLPLVDRHNALALAKENKPVIIAELQRRATLPSWLRPHVPGETLDDTKERRCVSARCGAVLMRQEENDTSWSYKRYCCAACYSGQPSIPVEVVNENSH